MVVVEQASVSKDEDLYRLREAMRRAVAEKAAGETVSKAQAERYGVATRAGSAPQSGTVQHREGGMLLIDSHPLCLGTVSKKAAAYHAFA